MSILVDEYMMLLQTQNGGKVIVDARPALQSQLRKILISLKEHLKSLPDHEYRYFYDFSMMPTEWQAWLKEAGLPRR